MDCCPHEKIIAKLEQDMYYGNGKPALTARVGTVEARMDRMDLKMDSYDKKFNWALALLIVNLVAMIANLVKH
jgi:hypothetical protein